MKYKHIIWDWNGTVVDDIALSVASLNGILGMKGLPEISLERYRATFSFPVSRFYEGLGINLDPKEADRLGRLFMQTYNAGRFSCRMHEGVESLMEGIRGRGIAQSILSAYHQAYLDEAAAHYGVDRFMSNIAGLDNIRAETKVARGLKLISGLDAEPSQILVIGDTDHDLAVAKASGADAALVSLGHQSENRLRATGAKTFTSFKGLAEYILGSVR